jgi:amino acid adenylation domain-containing protein/non-ribosomal peptide synthase protein (TIGR01720 family)
MSFLPVAQLESQSKPQEYRWLKFIKLTHFRGTIIQHRAFCSGAASHGPALRMHSSSRVLQFASFTFDASILEILTTLIVGGCVCVPSDSTRMNAITDVINDMNVSWTLLTPSFVQIIQPSAVPTLRTLVLGGEAMSQTHVSTWADKLELLNAYGPSEAAIVSTVSSQLSLSADPMNMGRAVGSHSWIIDSLNPNRLVPIGASGELVIDGPILSQGYLNNREKTAEAFITAPEWAVQIGLSTENSSRRLYRTGDIVKYTSNGELVYCGRQDTQTKLHGQRLELAEVEHYLRIDPSIQHAMALVPKDGLCKKRLVAVVSLQELAATNSSDTGHLGLKVVVREASNFYLSAIRDRLRGKLSASFMPSNWVILQSLPLLPSGKLDRRQIETWVENMDSETYQQIANITGENDIIGGTEIERQLQKILGTALNLPPERISLQQSFLHLGGDSLSAMQVMSTARSQGLGISVQDIIQSKSISELALCVARPENIAEEVEAIDQHFGLSPVQKLYFDCAGNQPNHFNQSVILQLTRPTNIDDIEAAIQAIVNAHSMLRARFARNPAGVWQQKITSNASFRYQACSAASDEIQPLIRESQNSLDVQNGPILAVDVFDVEGRQQILSIVAHHLVVDVVSWRIILQDLEDILRGGKTKLQSSTSFQKWSRLQLEHAQQTMARAALNVKDTPVADLGYWDMEDKPNTYGDTVEDEFELDSETSLLLLGICHEAMKTETVDVLLGSLFHSFRKVFSGRSAMPAIYNEGHGRERWEGSKIDLSRTLGWFTTMCPLHIPTTIEGDDDLLNTIRWVKDLRRRIPDKGRPYFAYRTLTEEGQERFSSHWPMEILFNFLGKMDNLGRFNVPRKMKHPEQFNVPGTMDHLERDDTLLQPIDDINSAVFDIGGDVPRFALFEISAAVTNGAIKMSFSYNRHMRRKAQISRWVIECQRCLQEAAKRLVQMTPERTLSEFPLLPLAYNGISKLAELLPQLGVHSIEYIEDVYPCSPVQQGILLAQLKHPDLYAYSSILEVCPLDGHPINPNLLAEAWQSVVRRHATLRTVFIDSICQQGLNDQVVLRDGIARISWLECKDSHAMEDFEQQGPLNFVDFQPPHRLTLCKTDRNRILCKLEISHAISDGTSIPILLRDFSVAYTHRMSQSSNSDSLTTKHPDDSLEKFAATSYSEYISHIQSAPVDTDINYWKAYLTGVQPCHLDGLTDGLEVQKKLKTLVLPLTRSLDLESFCTKNGLTMSNVLQFVWALVLQAYVGTDEVVFGYLTSGRDAPIQGIQEAVGTFINMLSCRIHLDTAMTITDALHKIQNDFMNGLAHQSTSLGDIQHELQLSTKSLFNTAFTFQKRNDDRRRLISPTPLIDFKVLDAHDPNEYDVTINVEATSARVEIHLGYWTSCMSDAQAVNVAKTFEHAVDEIMSHSEQTLGDIDLFSNHSHEQVKCWNRALPTTVDRCIHDMIHDQTLGHHQDVPALCAWDANFTYAQMDDLATRLSLYLIERGVKPEIYVPLCFQKSAWMAISMLAVMKSGSAFVPLDYTHPHGRMKNFIDDVHAEFVLCSKESLQKLSGTCKHVIIVDMDLLVSLKYKTETFICPTISPDSPAYVIFTSGTTGRPKGTIIEHAAFCTSAIEHSKAMNMNSTSRALQFASHTFDASVMEILTTLIVGGCVCIPSEQDRMNNIPGVIKAMKVTWTLLTPSVASTISPKSVPSLKTLVTGGEKMSPGHIKKWKDQCCLINAYGPSETSVIASVGWKVDEHGNELNADPLNIGRAVGSRAWIVDPHDSHKLMCVGGIGELVIEGRTVARGYLNNVEKTSEAFISDPKWLQDFEPKQRVYRTGDLVRYNSDGSLSFVARKDTQVKLNGQRIELGEIEYNVKLLLPEDCQSAVELVAPSQVGTKALAVFYSPQADDYDSQREDERVSGMDEILLSASHSAKQIAKHLDSSLASALPTYMIPSFFVPVTRIPWTSSGKLDRARLRNILQSLPMEMTDQYRPGHSDNQALVAPTSSMEKKLQKLWDLVLNITTPNSIGVEDSFFRQGGDSVAAMKLVGLARAESISLTVMDIFRNPRLCDMASVCTTLVETQQVKIEPFSLLNSNDSVDNIIQEVAQQCQVSRDKVLDVYPCSLLQEGLVTLSTKQTGAYVIRNIFKLPRDVDLVRFKNVWDKTVNELDILRTRIVHMSSSAFVQAVLRHEPIQWNAVDRLDDLDHENVQLPANNGGKLTRYTIVSESHSENRYFVWHIHHALYDGWSLPMILQKVENMYQDTAPKLPSRTYSTFIQYLSSVNQQASNDYWRTLLTGANPLQFPQNQHLALNKSSNSQTLKHTSNISRNTVNMGITVATIIRAAWATVVAAYSGSNDVVFGETMAGRNIPVEGIAEIIGPTITTVPTRIQVDYGRTVAQYLHHVQKMATEVIPYQHVGLQRIKRLSSDAELACDFQNLLVIQTAEEEIESKLWDLQMNEVGSNFFTYPLVLECKGNSDKVEIVAHYDSGVLSSWQMQRILYQLDYVLRQFSDLSKLGTNSRLDAVEVFAPEDRELVREWNSEIPRSVDACIHDEFEDMSLAQPSAQAIDAWDGSLTYQELRDHATRLAYHLSELGVGPEVFVPICMDKSIWAVVGTMAILIAGGAFVPWDSMSPEARYKEMLKDVGAALVLCSPHYRSRFTGFVHQVLPIDQKLFDHLSKVATPTRDLRRATAQNAAYVIFTSGSTGSPKGTVLEHRAISTSSVAMKKCLSMSSNARVFQFASFSFDVSILETLTTLTCGGTLNSALFCPMPPGPDSSRTQFQWPKGQCP